MFKMRVRHTRLLGMIEHDYTQVQGIACTFAV